MKKKKPELLPMIIKPSWPIDKSFQMGDYEGPITALVKRDIAAEAWKREPYLKFLDMFLQIFEHDKTYPHPRGALIPGSNPPTIEHYYVLVERQEEEGPIVWGVHCPSCKVTNPLPMHIPWNSLWAERFKPIPV